MKMQEIFEGIESRPAAQGFTRGMVPEFEVEGHKYFAEFQDEEDVRKILHYVVDPAGTEHHMDWSSYSEPSKSEVALWIQLGMPTRRDIGSSGPIHSGDLEQYAQQRG